MAAATASIIGATGSLATAYTSAEASRAQGEYQKRMYELNQGMAEFQAKDIIRRGDKESAQMAKKVKQTVGAQRAALAAQGVDVDSGSAIEVQEDTQLIGAKDALTIKNNAWREAWGFKVQAIQMGAQGEFAKMAAGNQARNTMLTGGLQSLQYGAMAAHQWDSGKRATIKTSSGVLVAGETYDTSAFNKA